MHGEYQRNHQETFDATVSDPWVVAAYFERVLSRLPHSHDSVRAHARLTERGNLSAATIDELRAKLRPADIEALSWITLACLDLSYEPGVWSLRIDLMLDQSPARIDIDVGGPDEDEVLQWQAVLQGEVKNALITARDGLPLPASVSSPPASPDDANEEAVVMPNPGAVSHSRLLQWMHDFSAQLAAGVAVAVVLAVAGLLWRQFG